MVVILTRRRSRASRTITHAACPSLRDRAAGRAATLLPNRPLRIFRKLLDRETRLLSRAGWTHVGTRPAPIHALNQFPGHCFYPLAPEPRVFAYESTPLVAHSGPSSYKLPSRFASSARLQHPDTPRELAPWHLRGFLPQASGRCLSALLVIF